MSTPPRHSTIHLDEVLEALGLSPTIQSSFIDYMVDREGVILIALRAALSAELSAQLPLLPTFEGSSEGQYTDDDGQPCPYLLSYHRLPPMLARYFGESPVDSPPSSPAPTYPMSASTFMALIASPTTSTASVSTSTSTSTSASASPLRPSSSNSFNTSPFPTTDNPVSSPPMDIPVPSVVELLSTQLENSVVGSPPFEDIQVAAYYLAEHSGFQRDSESCWYEAELSLREP